MPIKALKLAHNLGQPCTIFRLGAGPRPAGGVGAGLLGRGAELHRARARAPDAEVILTPPRISISRAVLYLNYTGRHQNDVNVYAYHAFVFIGTTFRELGWKTLICFERAAPISPNASVGAARGAACQRPRC